MSKYWEKRVAKRMLEIVNLTDKEADTIAKIYLKASRYLSNKADDIFEKFQTKFGLSESEARRLILMLHDKQSIEELLRLLKQNKKKEVLAELESVVYQARLERLRQLQNELDIVMRNVYQQERQTTTSFYTDLAKESYYKSVFDIQQRTGVGFDFSHISEKQIDHVLSSPWSGMNYSKRIWRNTNRLAQDLKEELLINLLTGRSNREAAQMIANKFAAAASNARRLVHTESNYISSEMNYEAYKEAGIERYQFLATLDLRTSKLCQSLDGQIFLVSERKVGVNCNPMHPWCRSTTVAVIEGIDLKEKTRSAIDPNTGRAIKVSQSMTYPEWYEKFVEGKKKTLVNDEDSDIIQLADINKMFTAYERDVLDKIPPKQGYFDVAVHGSAKYVCYGTKDKVITAREMARIIKHDKNYHGEKIRLLSCSTGKDKDGFAQNLANALGVEVEAPSDKLYIAPDGRYWIGLKGDGEMLLFKPGKEE